MSTLYVANQQWQVAIAHIQSLSDNDAYQLFYQDQYGGAAITWACGDNSAPLELGATGTRSADDNEG